MIQALIALALVAVLCAAGVASLKAPLDWRRLEGHTHELLHTLHWGRSLAVSAKNDIRLSVQQTTAGSCYVVYSGSTGSCTCDAAGIATCSAGSTAYKSTLISNNDRIQRSSNVNALMWEPHQGRATPAGSLTLTHANGNTLKLVVNMLGRVRACVPAGASTRGYATC
jgi:type IV fimbrial biogenesis protein FimT